MFNPTVVQTAPSFFANIWIAGDLEAIRTTCRQFCFNNPLCVSITPTEYIYTGAAETGACVRLINYPRFPTKPSEVMKLARSLAVQLMQDCSQRSATIESSTASIFLTRRYPKGKTHG